MRNSVKKLSLIIAAFVILASGYTALKIRRWNTSAEHLSRKTTEQLHYLDLFLYEVSYHHSNTPLRQLIGGQPGETLNEKLAMLVVREGAVGGVGTDSAGKVLLLDAWARPLHVMLPEGGSNDMVFDLKRNRPLIIWSSGPDGTNDSGFNDDVYFPIPEGRVRANQAQTASTGL